MVCCVYWKQKDGDTMPLPAALRNMKIAPLGNFHENVADLPSFYQNYQTIDRPVYEGLIGTGLGAIPNGMNSLVRVDDEHYYLYINSTSHAVLKLNEGVYCFDQMFRSNAADETVPIDFEMPAGAESNIRGVFSTQFSACGLQLAFLGGTTDDPEYVVVSHLQNRSRVNSIARQIEVPHDSIHGLFSIMSPQVDSGPQAIHNLPGFENKSVVMIRDSHLWPVGYWLGFGMALCGYTIEGNNLRLVMNPVYTTLFSS